MARRIEYPDPPPNVAGGPLHGLYSLAKMKVQRVREAERALAEARQDARVALRDYDRMLQEALGQVTMFPCCMVCGGDVTPEDQDGQSPRPLHVTCRT